MHLDDESDLQVNVQPPKQKKQRMTTVLSSWQFSTHEQDSNIVKLFLCANEIYIRNLINKKQQPSFKDEIKGKIIPGTILYQMFKINFKKANGLDQQPIPYEGELMLVHLQYRGIKLVINFGLCEVLHTDYLAARFLLYEGQGEDPRIKTMRMEMSGDNLWECMIEDGELDKFVKQRLAVQIVFQKENVKDQRFVGIKNQGNTCYMNAILQILFFMKPLRKTIVEYDGQGKIILALKQIFLSLMAGPQSRSGPIDAQDLIQAYGRFSDYPRRQQDTHQFLLGFLQQLQGECPSLSQLWQGQSRQQLQSIQPEKPYTSSIKEDYNGLDLPLEDVKGNTFAHLIQALRYVLEPELVDDKIQSDDFGKVAVKKHRQFLGLPPVLFLTLKRYQFKKSATRPTKILADLGYPSQLNLGFLLGTPTGDDDEYILYAVTVHCGQHYNSGHYYSFVNTSADPDIPIWMKFNDSRVYLASEKEALSFTGGKRKTVGWSKEYERFDQKQYAEQNTAYILVYFKRSLLFQYQNIETPIPKSWVAKKRQQKLQQRQAQQADLYNVEVAIADMSIDCQIFGQISTIPVGLKPHEDTVSQLMQLDYNLLGCKVGSVWKVNKNDGKVKNLVQFADLVQTPSRIFDPKRGHRRPDYLLIIPYSVPIYNKLTSLADKNKIGIVRETVIDENGVTAGLKIIRKPCFDDFVSQEEGRLGRKGNVVVEEKENFMADWNDFCTLIFE